MIATQLHHRSAHLLKRLLEPQQYTANLLIAASFIITLYGCAWFNPGPRASSEVKRKREVYAFQRS